MWARKAVEDGIAVAGVACLNTDGNPDTTWGSAGLFGWCPLRRTPSSTAPPVCMFNRPAK
ncbi:MAG: hypothetical protein IPP88_21815 [Betaproteobacteria bacterium]|nr:hypothetical protein [Betaproteobacteria bacterium]